MAKYGYAAGDTSMQETLQGLHEQQEGATHSPAEAEVAKEATPAAADPGNEASDGEILAEDDPENIGRLFDTDTVVMVRVGLQVQSAVEQARC